MGGSAVLNFRVLAVADTGSTVCRHPHWLHSSMILSVIQFRGIPILPYTHVSMN